MFIQKNTLDILVTCRACTKTSVALAYSMGKHTSPPGSTKHPLYNTWMGIKHRCLNPKTSNYKNYGGRGISICDAWFDFWTFVEDVFPRPEGHQLDRIDNNGDYCPENCRWVTPKSNSNNRSNSKGKE